MIIGLVGLVSAGKSSIINALVGDKVAKTGICRTTTEPSLYENLISDDNIKYNIYDLPGISDIEDTTNKYTEVVYSIIKKCNIVFWVSDIHKAFLTKHELTEFEKIKTQI